MKKKLLFLLSTPLLLSLFCFNNNNMSSVEGANSSLPKEITFIDNTEKEIRNYYSSIPNLKGDSLFSYFKNLLSNNQKTYTYENVSSIYKITDRDYVLSPVHSTTLSNYSYNDDPYIYSLYRNDNHTLTASKMSDNKASYSIIDKEHVWAKSIGGFGEISPAGTDLHHLIAADHDNNSYGHNNNNYGEVSSSYTSIGGSYYNNTGKRGTITYNGHTETVYEPQDSDKGDIARALMYMATRYSSFTSTSDPFLELVDYPTADAQSSSSTESAKQGIISLLLKWHKNDPADDYEIHRNNLIYNNYQNNRNPFIDYPDLAEIIFDSSTSKTFNASSLKVRTINDNHDTPSSPTSISITGLKSSYYTSEVLYLVNNGTINVNLANGTTRKVYLGDERVTVKINDEIYIKGSQLTTPSDNVSISFIYKENNVSKTYSTTIQIKQAIENIDVEDDTLTLKIGSKYTINPIIVPESASGIGLNYTSQNSSIALVNVNGVIEAKNIGSTTITIKSKDEVGVSKDILVTVSNLDGEISSQADLSQNEDFLSWNSSYLTRTLNYSDFTLNFSNANKGSSSASINDVPVMRGGSNFTLKLNNEKHIKGIEIIFKQWASKNQTVTLDYSSDLGETFISTSISSSTFGISEGNLDNSTNAIRINTTNTSNQIGVYLIRLVYVEQEEFESDYIYFEKVDHELKDYTGQYLIVGTKQDKSYAFKSNMEELDKSNNTSLVSVNDKQIALSKTLLERVVIIERFNDNYSLKASNGYYLSNLSESNNLTSSSEPFETIIEYNNINNYSKIYSKTDNEIKTTLGFNATYNRIRFYVSDNYSNKIQLYKAMNRIDALESFVDNYMHMDMTSNKGLCKIFFPEAKAKLLDLENNYGDILSSFKNDNRFKDSKLRYETWARLLNQNPYSSLNNVSIINQDNQVNTNMIIIISVTTTSGLLFIGFALNLFIVIRKERKHGKNRN